MTGSQDKLLAGIRSFFPTAKVDITTLPDYVRVQFPRGDTDSGALSETFEAIGNNAGYEFDGYDEDGFACFIGS